MPRHTTASFALLAGLSSAALAQSPATPTHPPTPTATDAAPASAPAERAPASLEQVDIIGTANDTALRRESTAAKLIIGREELDRMGDSSVSEVLKRLPGVTLGGRPGRGGAVRMRGLGGGYTQILINGERLSAGLSLDDLSPEQVERIEVLRAPTAETGAQAIAGTINVVLREDLRKRLNQFALTETLDDGHLQHGLAWSRADQLGDLNYSFNGQLMRMDRESSSELRTLGSSTDDASGVTTPTSDLLERRASRDQRLSLHAGGRLQWRLAGGDSLSLMPFAIVSRSDGVASSTRTDPLAPLVFDNSRGTSEGEYRLLRVNGQWQGRFDGGARLEVRGGGSRSMFGGDSERTESLAGSDNRRQQDHTEITESWWSTGGKYTRNLAGDHQLAAGWEGEFGRRTDSRSSVETPISGGVAGTPRSLLLDFGDDLQARTVRSALWAQDEWAVNGQWSLHGGLRWEGIRTASDTPGAPVRNTSQVLSPLLHAVYRLEEGGRDQIRASLTRSYRAPTLQNLAARPSINRNAPVSAGNLVTQPDRAGNPDLQPELATGLDLNFERYLNSGGVLSAGVFHRRIQQLIRNVTQLETVSWSASQRYVSRPQNIGNASTSGIELEAKLRLDELVAPAVAQVPGVELRGNLALFRSRVDGIVGPDNRLDQQPGWTANLGADHRLRGWPVKLGANLALTPGYAVQQSDSLRTEQDAKRVLDAYLQWTFSPTVSLRVSASNLTPRDSVSRTASVNDNGTTTLRETTIDTEPSQRVWAVRLEVRL